MTQLEMNYRDGGAGYKAPGPSQEAAEEMNKRAAYLRAKCLKALQEHGPLTADEVAAKIGETPFSTRPRMTELLSKPYPERALITDTGIRRKNASGRNATVWQIAR